MANTNFNNDSVHTNTFTPREYQVELLERAKRKNIIICSSTSSSKSFLAIKLVQELAYQMRSPNGRRAFYIVNPSNTILLSEHIRSLTDLEVFALDGFYPKVMFLELMKKYAVFVMSLEVCVQVLGGCLNGDMSSINLLVIDDGLYGERESCIQQIMNMYLKNNCKPRIVGLVSGLLSEKMMPNYLEGEMVRLESMLQASIDTSSDISALIRVGRPKELLVSCNDSYDNSLLNDIREMIINLDYFLEEHRYDPSEIYDEEFLEEFRNIPDPKMIPKDLLKDFIQILDEFGVWGGNQAALQILILIEKLKVKVAYERHYLLLCVLGTTMLSVRALCDEVIPQVCTAEDIMKWTTSKVHRLIEILKVMGPGERPEIEEPPIEPLEPPVGKYGRKNYKGQRKQYYLRNQLEDSICCLIFVSNTLMAKVLHSLISTLSACDPALWWVGILYTVDKIANPQTESREAEQEHRRQEEVLRKFRAHECNIMIATSVLEQGFDLPKCNLVIKLDIAKNFHSYIQSKARARALFSYYVSLFYKHTEDQFMQKYSEFMEVENILLKRSNSLEPGTDNISAADTFCEKHAPYVTKENEAVHLTTAIQIINRYCAKLPSDTFTKLVPNCVVNTLKQEAKCYLRLPINSPVKETVKTNVFENAVIAKRHAAFYMVQLLHKSNELDDFLNPITKEKFNATDEDWNDFSLEKEDECLSSDNIDQRPGTTKRRQYYYKRVADTLQGCMPKSNSKTYFYTIVMTLTCPIPEEQNTRGRKIYPPEDSIQGFGILTSKEIPQICPFPIFTRSGEVKVNLELCRDDVCLTQDEIHKIKEFLNYTFTSVLRLQKYQMLFDPSHSQNSYFIVPTIKDANSVNIDWKFLDLIYSNRDVLPESIPDEDRADYIFDPSQYKDAVVMPWYRNQDQPQYFYVAEICNNLNPASAFPGSEYATFEEYYNRKYGIQIRNNEQHLLDVDHTSARLNFLTPRYVNRKGVALPTSSEETKRAKRENLEQKQILVPELCAIHPFPASLWRKAVCLPCVLYRINALLLADQIRRKVAQEINLGKLDLSRSYIWDPLNFGWSLSDVLKKSKPIEDSKIPENNEEAVEVIKYVLDDILLNVEIATEIPIVSTATNSEMENNKTVRFDETEFVAEEDKTWIEIGTWSNDMIETNQSTTQTSVRYGSPTSWVHSTYGYNEYDDFSDSDTYYSSDDDNGTDSQCGGLHIEFQGEYLAEAVETAIVENKKSHDLMVTKAWDYVPNVDPTYNIIFNNACSSNFHQLQEKSLVHPQDPIDAYICRHKSEHKEQINYHGNMAVAEYFPKKSFSKPAQIRACLNLSGLSFSFDMQPNLEEHPGPSPSVILQALTMSNANDGINLERLETIGDSFLKYAITDYLYSKYCNTHEGKLSHLRSKQVSNLNLYRLGKRKQLGELMIASKFDPHDNWLPPCYCVSKELEEAVNKTRIQGNYLTLADYVSTRNMSLEQICSKIREEGENIEDISEIPYDLVTQHSIPDKSIADCVEALIGAYLIECGPRGALLFMAWLGIRVLPKLDDGSYGELPIPDSPLLQHVHEPDTKLNLLLDGYDKFEDILGYNFNDRSYLLQALTHASYFPNEITDCYQRLEFLGDAVLDYLITRHLYEDQRMHSPGALTDLRSALVNNTIFASLSVKYNFHKYFRYLSPGLHQVIEKFIRIQEEMGHKVSEELFLLDVEENDEVEDIEVPKVLGDIFESVAGAIFLDSGRSLDAVWKVYYGMMRAEIEQFSDKVPKSPIRELLELEPETAKFGPAEKLADGRRVRVAVEVFGKGVFRGIGRNYRIAKCTAAKCALKHLKKQTYPSII